MLKKKIFFSGALSGLNENLVAYYSFDNNNAVDVVNGYNGTLVGTLQFNAGVNGNGVEFLNDATARYIDIPDNNDFSFTDGVNDLPFSISLWVNFTAFGSTGNWLINKRGGTSGTDEWQIVYSSSLQKITITLFDKITNSAFIRALSDAQPLLNQWYHIVCTYDGSNNVAGLNMYVNGVLQSTKTTGGIYTGMPNGVSITRMGIPSWLPSADFKHRGKLDEVAIWKNRELTQSEVDGLYNNGAGKFYPF